MSETLKILQSEMRALNDSAEGWMKAAKAAEKRLAEATALLWTVTDARRTNQEDYTAWDESARTFLSSAPSPAAGTPEQQFQEWAETHPDNPERRAPAPAAEPVLCHPTDPCVHGITGPCSRCQPAPSLSEQLQVAIQAILSEGHPYSKGAAEAVGIMRAIQRREAGGR